MFYHKAQLLDWSNCALIRYPRFYYECFYNGCLIPHNCFGYMFKIACICKLPIQWVYTSTKTCILVDNCTATTTSVSMSATTTANSVLINSNTYNSCKYINIFIVRRPRGLNVALVWLPFTYTISVKHR